MTAREIAFAGAGLMVGAVLMFCFAAIATWLEKRGRRRWFKRLSHIPFDDNRCAVWGDVPHVPGRGTP